MAGRKPKPTHLKLVAGNPGKRALNKQEPKPKRGAPKAPDHLSERATKAWEYVAPILDKIGVLTVADGLALELLCEAYADYLDARDELEAFGSNYYATTNEAGATMHRAHPAVAVKNDADRRIKAWFAEFGLTPSARTRVKADGEQEKDDPAEKYFT